VQEFTQVTMENTYTALVSGGTGLIGGLLTAHLLQSEQCQSVHSLLRRPTERPHLKLHEHVINFDKMEVFTGVPHADYAFCCLGTTMKKAGSKEAFLKIDFEYVISFGKLAKRLGCQRFFLVSALGADKHSIFFYNQVKGQTEEAVASLGFAEVHFLRPSLLLGTRSESRLGESLGKVFAKTFNWAIPAEYKAIEGAQVAAYIANLASKPLNPGVHIHSSQEMASFEAVSNL
jgi:uncharacterized protein YbjT (DUF2867 family)